jgi:hypothetical protein
VMWMSYTFPNLEKNRQIASSATDLQIRAATDWRAHLVENPDLMRYCGTRMVRRVGSHKRDRHIPRQSESSALGHEMRARSTETFWQSRHRLIGRPRVSCRDWRNANDYAAANQSSSFDIELLEP